MLWKPCSGRSHSSQPAQSLYTDGVDHNLEAAASPRILALDVGSKTIGLAVSDALGITAQGLETIRRKNKRYDMAALHSAIRRYAVAELVVGLPLRMSGQAGTQAEKATAFAEELRRKFNLPVHLQDERLTSVEANRMLRESEISIRKRAGAVDRLAAVLILQSFMEHRRATRAEGKTRE
jgi:putative Holliday junction resolvase